MGEMPVLTLWQPWASLIAIGAKWIETRSWSTRYRGPLAIHAAKTTEGMELVMAGKACREDDAAICNALAAHGFGCMAELPLGKIIATCTLADVVPVVASDLAEAADLADLPYPRIESAVSAEGFPEFPDGWLDLWHPTLGSALDPDGSGRSLPDQAIYGDFTPSRFGWLLTDVQPLAEPVPFHGGQALSRRWTPEEVVSA